MTIGEEVREWVKTLSVVAAIAGAIVGVAQYHVAAQAEQRQHDADRAQTDIKLSQEFAELMRTANGRGKSQLVNACADKLTGPSDRKSLDQCVVEFPVGQAQQIAAIAAVGTLGREFPVLREAAAQGLKELSSEFASYPSMAAATQHALQEVESAKDKD